MPTVFTRIIDRELPGRFVYEDESCSAFLTIAPVAPGHTLVVTRREVDDWLELTDTERNALWAACATVAKGIDTVFKPAKVAAMLIGLEVPHVHVHLIPISDESQLDFGKADGSVEPTMLDEIAASIAAAISAGSGS